MKCKDFEAVVQVFRRGNAFLIQERDEKKCEIDEMNAKLAKECVDHKRTAISAQKTCEQHSSDSLQAKTEASEKHRLCFLNQRSA